MGRSFAEGERIAKELTDTVSEVNSGSLPHEFHSFLTLI